jgi:hypothetical protein
VPGYRLALRLEPHEFYRTLGLRAAGGWATLDPLAPKSARALERLELFVRSGAARLGEARLYESPSAAELEACEWFELANRFFKGNPGFSLWDDYPSCRSAAIPEGIHLFADCVVSSAFRALVKARRLRGLEFLRVKEKSRKPRLAWFVALPHAPLGQGVDHPWFDRPRWEAYLRAHPTLTRDQDAARPPTHFRGAWVRDAAYRSEPLLARFARLLPEKSETPLEGLAVFPVARYWRKRIPAADFAYVPLTRDGPNREGKVLRFRGLCASRRARDALLRAGLLREQDAVPLAVVDAPPAGAPNLDRRHPPAPPMYTAEELAALRAAERSLRP